MNNTVTLVRIMLLSHFPFVNLRDVFNAECNNGKPDVKSVAGELRTASQRMLEKR